MLLKSMGVLSSPHRAAAAHCADDFCRTAGRQAADLAGLHGALRGTRVRGSCLNWSPHRRSLGDLESSEATALLLKNVNVVPAPFHAAAAQCAADFRPPGRSGITACMDAAGNAPPRVLFKLVTA